MEFEFTTEVEYDELIRVLARRMSGASAARFVTDLIEQYENKVTTLAAEQSLGRLYHRQVAAGL